MPDLAQVPGRLNLTVTQGDDFSFQLDFDVETVSWTLVAVVDLASPVSFTLSNATGGIVTLSLTSGQTAALPLGITNWYLDRSDTGSQRRYVAGTLNVVQYYV